MNTEHYNFDELNRTADITTLKGIPSDMIRTTAKELHGPCPFGGPADHTGFWINITETPMTWACRHKGEPGCKAGCTGGGDAMQYIAIRENLNRQTPSYEIADIKQRIAEKEHLDIEKDAKRINYIRWNNPEYRTEAEQVAAILADEIGAAPSSGPIPSGSSFKKQDQPQARTPEQPPLQWQKLVIPIVDQAANYLYSDTAEAEAALLYLHDRGLSDRVIKKHKVGYIPFQKYGYGYYIDPVTGERYYRKLTDDEKKKAIRVPEGITIPTFINGHLFRVKVRMMEHRTIEKAAWLDKIQPNVKHLPKHCRYSNISGSLKSLFNADAAAMTRPRADIIFCAGEMDALLINSLIYDSDYGYLQAVTFGSETDDPHFETYYRYFRTPNRIAIIYDNDSAGKNGAEDLYSQILKVTTRETPPVIATIPKQYKDFGNWYEHEGKGGIIKYLWDLFPLE